MDSDEEERRHLEEIDQRAERIKQELADMQDSFRQATTLPNPLRLRHALALRARLQQMGTRIHALLAELEEPKAPD